MLTKRALANTLGLSCVEKYFLAWLSHYTDITSLYGSSFVGLMQVLDDFAHGALYQNYCRLPRLQDVAEEYGIVRHEFCQLGKESAIRLLQSRPADALCLMRVNANFFVASKRAPWREDHYVCVDGALRWINEYPLGEGKFTAEEFASVYDGAIIMYCLQNAAAHVDDFVTRAFIAQDFRKGRLPSDVLSFESAIGVLRVTRKRLEQFYENHARVKELLHKENVKMDNLYFLLRVAQIKGGNSVEKAYKELDDCMNIEQQIAEELQNERKINK